MLPVALTTFIGREREVAEIRELLGTVRLLSLVGTGGVGKTRLALEVARSTTLGNVYLVELGPVAEPSLVGRSAPASWTSSNDPTRRLSQRSQSRLETNSSCWCWTTAST